MQGQTEVQSSPPKQAVPWFSRLGNLAQITSAVISLLGFCAILFQLNALQQTERNRQHSAAESAARQVYMSYSESALRFPKFASPLNLQIDPKKNPEEYEQYKLFVSHMLYAYDEMLTVFPDSSEWRASFEQDLALHIKYICEENPELFAQYYERVRNKLNEVRRNCANSSAPPSKR